MSRPSRAAAKQAAALARTAQRTTLDSVDTMGAPGFRRVGLTRRFRTAQGSGPTTKGERRMRGSASRSRTVAHLRGRWLVWQRGSWCSMVSNN
jgi:hypothetical protein